MTTKKITSKMFEATNKEGTFKVTNTFGTWVVYAPNGNKSSYATKREAIRAINLRFHLYA